MLKLPGQIPHPSIHLEHEAVLSEHTGLWYPRIKPGDEIAAGQVIGEIRKMDGGDVLQEAQSAVDGIALSVRSGLAARHGVVVPNAPGTIDADYRGEVCVILGNIGREPFTVTRGMRIAQMVISPVTRAEIVEVETLDETPRGSGGFGHTGV